MAQVVRISTASTSFVAGILTGSFQKFTVEHNGDQDLVLAFDGSAVDEFAVLRVPAGSVGRTGRIPFVFKTIELRYASAPTGTPDVVINAL